MTSLFIDTSYLIAVEIADDQEHDAALAHWRKLLTSSPPRIVTTSFIFAEVITLLNSRRLHSKSVELGKKLLNSRSINLVHVDQELFHEGWVYFQKHKDKRYSLTDCISFVLMKRLGIEQALTFDQHFVQAGLVKLP
jgi:predicted nucleic acid-binding protein